MIMTNSAFIYGIFVNDTSNIVAFDEGNGELLATLRSGKYTLTTYLNEVLRAMNEVAVDGVYSGSVNRNDRTYSINGDIPFDLLVATGSTSASAFQNMGFTGADRTGDDSYTGDSAVGSVYQPQFRLQSFVDFKNNQRAVESTANISASGQVELVRFGVVRIMEAEITFITDIDQGVGSPIRTELQGEDKARAFMEYATTKGPMEFVPDVLDPDTFNYCILESTPESRDGVDFKIKEMIARRLIGYYTTGLLTFREVTL